MNFDNSYRTDTVDHRSAGTDEASHMSHPVPPFKKVRLANGDDSVRVMAYARPSAARSYAQSRSPDPSPVATSHYPDTSGSLETSEQQMPHHSRSRRVLDNDHRVIREAMQVSAVS